MTKFPSDTVRVVQPEGDVEVRLTVEVNQHPARWREELARMVVWSWWGVAVVLMLGLLWRWYSPPPFDATDAATQGVRSGFKLMMDYGTGCQYLVTKDGAITPRLGVKCGN